MKISENNPLIFLKGETFLVNFDLLYFNGQSLNNFNYSIKIPTILTFLSRAALVLKIESLMSQQSGREVSKTIKEVQMSTDRTYHFMTTLPEKKDALLVLITDRSANLGMGWMKLRSTAPKVQPHCP